MIGLGSTTALAILAGYLYVLGIFMVISAAMAIKEFEHSVDTKKAIIVALVWPLAAPWVIAFGRPTQSYDTRQWAVLDDFHLTANQRPQPDEPTIDPEIPTASRR